MNAIEENQFSRKWKEIGKSLPQAKAILVISAHYETNGVKISSAQNQKTIHDFYGFLDELFAVQYPARGDLARAQRVLKILGEGEDDEIIAAIQANDHQKIINFATLKNSKLAIPTNEHFLPLLYILGLKRPSDKIEIFNQQLDLGSISMTGVMFLEE